MGEAIPREARITPVGAARDYDADYKDTDGDGVLNDPNNGDKNTKLRLSARVESPQSQTMSKLITDWWE